MELDSAAADHVRGRGRRGQFRGGGAVAARHAVRSQSADQGARTGRRPGASLQRGKPCRATDAGQVPAAAGRAGLAAGAGGAGGRARTAGSRAGPEGRHAAADPGRGRGQRGPRWRPGSWPRWPHCRTSWSLAFDVREDDQDHTAELLRDGSVYGGGHRAERGGTGLPGRAAWAGCGTSRRPRRNWSARCFPDPGVTADAIEADSP